MIKEATDNSARLAILDDSIKREAVHPTDTEAVLTALLKRVDAQKNNHSTEPEAVLTEREAAKVLKIAQITLRRARLRGEIDYSRAGLRKVVYQRSDVLNYLLKRRNSATS